MEIIKEKAKIIRGLIESRKILLYQLLDNINIASAKGLFVVLDDDVYGPDALKQENTSLIDKIKIDNATLRDIEDQLRNEQESLGQLCYSKFTECINKMRKDKNKIWLCPRFEYDYILALRLGGMIKFLEQLESFANS